MKNVTVLNDKVQKLVRREWSAVGRGGNGNSVPLWTRDSGEWNESLRETEDDEGELMTECKLVYPKRGCC